ncbi:arginine deiminase [Peribacillus kribbensis]|uniref:arginine deiminase n=1 Tax=Peribacillus kribbensis TaxID=356658 RepID=UPI0004165BBB|nr:arginine deiminase [Peribacillus kribbensis]
MTLSVNATTDSGQDQKNKSFSFSVTKDKRKSPLHVHSEIGALKTVMLKRPGGEIEHLIPDYLERLLFDDIPYLPAIQKEHDFFADSLRKRGVEVVYLENLAMEAIHSREVRMRFIEDIIKESCTESDYIQQSIKEYLMSLSPRELIHQVMKGMLKAEVNPSAKALDLHAEYPFCLDPMPNLYFTRDPAAVIGNGISINRMDRTARQRETLFMDYIINHHPRFTSHDIPVWFNRDREHSLEGGDILVLNKDVVAIGISDRTSRKAIEEIARSLFSRQGHVQKVVAIEIPKTRAFMHLDTVFTMVDHDKFTIHPGIQKPDGKMDIYIIEPEEEGDIRITHRDDLFGVLKDVLHLKDLVLIPCGGGDPIAAAREQWNDGSNTLAIAPGVVVTYDRNYISNETLRSNGIEVIEILSSELARGRGGPRCMSMPLYREDILPRH